MDLEFNKRRDSDGTVDFRRFVLLFAHRFSDRIRFVSELEIEHALVEGGEDKGSVELEQAYLDFLIDRRVNIRAGQMLVPVGLINERHEPPVFHGVLRPFVDTVVIPTTWFDAGVVVFGEFGRGWRYRAYAMAPLDATHFTADAGLSESAQAGSRANVRHWAGTGRVEYLGLQRLALGTSLWRGRTTAGSMPLDPRVTVAEVDGRGRVGRLDLRGELARVLTRSSIAGSYRFIRICSCTTSAPATASSKQTPRHRLTRSRRRLSGGCDSDGRSCMTAALRPSKTPSPGIRAKPNWPGGGSFVWTIDRSRRCSRSCGRSDTQRPKTVGTTVAVSARFGALSEIQIGSKTIVGVASDAVYSSIREPAPPTMYLPLAQVEGPINITNLYIAVRSSVGSPVLLTPSVAAALTAVNADLSLAFRPLSEQVNESLAQDRRVAVLSGFFGGLALLLAGLGLYGVTAYAVTRRRTEIGIRMALGADPAGVVRLVLGRVTMLVGIGVVVGAGLSLWASTFVAALLDGVEPRDPVTLVGAAGILAAVGAFAGWLPAWRASRIDPGTLQPGPPPECLHATR